MSVERYLEGLLAMLSSLLFLGAVLHLWFRCRNRPAPVAVTVTGPVPLVPGSTEGNQ